jgi:hypothetical protein
MRPETAWRLTNDNKIAIFGAAVEAAGWRNAGASRVGCKGRKAKMKYLLSAALVAMFSSTASAVYVFNGSNTTITENFDALAPLVGNFPATIGSQALVNGIQFDGTRLGGTGIVAANLVADAGNGNSGAIYSHGAVSATDRALGSIASGTNIMGFGFELKNSSTDFITEVRISFTQETWRNSTSTVNTTAASWSTSALASSYLTTGTFTPVTGLDLVGPAPVTTNGALDGNLPANQTARNAVLTFSTPIAPGGSLFVRWQDANDVGNDAGLSIDNMTLAITAIPEPTAYLFGALATMLGGGVAFGRRLFARS